VEIAKDVPQTGSTAGKLAYKAPRLIEYGSVTKITAKPGTRTDSSLSGNKGQGPPG
jgi:hypothetical protein